MRKYDLFVRVRCIPQYDVVLHYYIRFYFIFIFAAQLAVHQILYGLTIFRSGYNVHDVRCRLDKDIRS